MPPERLGDNGERLDWVEQFPAPPQTNLQGRTVMARIKRSFLWPKLDEEGTRTVRPTWKSLCLSAFVAATAISLTGCGGGGGGGGGPATQLPPDPTDPVDPPTPAYSVGRYAINGIDRIPQSMVKVTREQMQRQFVIADIDEDHAQEVGTIACESYIQSGDCDNHAGRFINADGTIRTEAGSSPFTKVVVLPRSDKANLLAFQEIAKMPAVRIVTQPQAAMMPLSASAIPI